MSAIAVGAEAQSFNSGSIGSDGPLFLTTPGTVLFDPRTFTPRLNPSCDNIYHFTTIHIGKGVTVKLSSNILNGPVFWLAQGPVQIDGVIDLSGEHGGTTPSSGGAGGFAGGPIRKAGYGPDSEFKLNAFLVPLVGGSGGAGGGTVGGGAGGGGLLIASSASIALNGSIVADGGSSVDGTGGNGGAIRLVAPIIEGSGSLSARGGRPLGADGRLRFEAFDNNFTGSLGGTPFAQGKPFGLFLPPNPEGSVRVMSVGGVPATSRELAISRSSAATVIIEARFITPGTVVQLEFFPETGASQMITTTPLKGTFELSRATALVAFPDGSTHCLVKAVWKQPGRALELQ